MTHEYKIGDKVKVLHTYWQEVIPVGSVQIVGRVYDDDGGSVDLGYDRLYFYLEEIEPYTEEKLTASEDIRQGDAVIVENGKVCKAREPIVYYVNVYNDVLSSPIRTLERAFVWRDSNCDATLKITVDNGKVTSEVVE